MSKELEPVIHSLSPNERAILPYLNLKDVSKVVKESKLDETSVKRALEFLSNKNIVKTSVSTRKVVSLGDNGVIYLKSELPERRLLNALSKDNELSLKDAREKAHLSENELSIALGVLKGKAMISLSQNGIKLNAKENELSKKSFEEKLLGSLPLNFENLSDEQKFALDNLKKRKDIVRIDEISEVGYEILPLGKDLLNNLDKIKDSSGMIESLTPEILRSGSWKNKKFRHYDITSKVPSVYGGRTHPLMRVVDFARKNFLEMGFKEMKGPWVETAFWNMDSMWIPQDHPSRELQDTFYLPLKGEIPKNLSKSISEVHEHGGKTGSKGYGYKWDPKVAMQLLLRTHTTAVTYRTFASGIKPPAKYFCIGRIFRNETIDSTHLPEFHQIEGFIMDENLTLRDLMGYIKEFYNKMGINKIKFRPTYNPYTEPSMEALGYNEQTGEWIELINSGIFRPEALEPYGIKVPVIAWGLGLERLAMLIYKKDNLKELIGATCDLDWLRSYKTPKIKW